MWRDCQDRQISDKRFVAYLKVLSEEGRKRLARARLRDIFSGEFESLVEVRTSTKEKGRSSNLALLSPESQAAIDKPAGEMAHDSKLHDWVMQFVKEDLLRRFCTMASVQKKMGSQRSSANFSTVELAKVNPHALIWLMPPQILNAERGVVEVLREARSPLSVAQVVQELRKKSDIMERDIRPSFWTLVASGQVVVDSSFRGKLNL